MAATDIQVNAATRFQVVAERVKQRQANEIAQDIRSLGDEISALLSTIDNLQQLNNSQLNTLIGTAGTLVSNYLEGKYKQDLNEINAELIGRTIGVEVDTLNEAIETEGFEAEVLPVSEAVQSYEQTPMTDGSSTGAILVASLLASLVSNEVQRVQNTIRGAYFNGLTTQEAIRSIRGTQANRFRDGKLETTRRAAESTMRTASQHAINTAKLATYERNEISKYEWVSTLDSKTSQQCRSLDGNVYEIGKGPLPPIHFNCRSTIVASPDGRLKLNKGDATRAARGPDGRTGRVDASTTYYQWLKRQPKSFQVIAIGKKRTELLNNGGLSAEEFAKLNLSKNFEPLTLEEMRKLRPEVFTQAVI